MNGNIKFHSPNGPAFAPGELWVGSSGSTYEVIGTRRWGEDKWDVDVTYVVAGTVEPQWTKDAWNFQVRFTHVADRVV